METGHLVRFELEDGGFLTVETRDEGAASGTERIARGEELETAGRKLQQAISSIKPAVAEIRGVLGELGADHVELAFGLTLSGKVGAFISAGAEANFTVSLNWEKSSEPTR